MKKYNELEGLLKKLNIKDLKIAFFLDEDKYFVTVVRDVNGQGVNSHSNYTPRLTYSLKN